MNKKIGAITRGQTLVCIECARDNGHIIDEWAWASAYPDGYTCDDCGAVYDGEGNKKELNREDQTNKKVENPGSWQKFMASVRSSNEATIKVLKKLEPPHIKDEPKMISTPVTGTPVDVRRESNKIIVLFSVGDISSEVHFFGENEVEAVLIEGLWQTLVNAAGEFNDWVNSDIEEEESEEV